VSELVRFAKVLFCALAVHYIVFLFLSFSSKLSIRFSVFFTLGGNVLQLQEVGDFEALHCQPSSNFDRSTKLDLTTEPPLLDKCC
jgi:hypothetical protein